MILVTWEGSLMSLPFERDKSMRLLNKLQSFCQWLEQVSLTIKSRGEALDLPDET